jgi:sugar lactone lactonase YvrE
MTYTIESLFVHRDRIGEGPFWDARTSTLVRVDVEIGEVRRLDPTTGEQRTTSLGTAVGFAIGASTGELVVAAGQELTAIDDDGNRQVLTALDHDLDPHRINDGKCDARGRLFFGTINSDDWAPTGGLYRFTGSGPAEQLVPGVTVSNGLGWDDARERFYYIDSITQRIDVFDYDLESGVPSGRRPFVEIPKDEGLPDGMEVDAEGGVWLALFGGGEVRRYAPDGTLSEVVTMPVSHPTSIAFGGPDLRTAYVTTARSWLDTHVTGEPLAGAVLTFDAGVPGRPAGVVAL